MKYILALVIALTTTQTACAWNGHRVIASIAFRELESGRRLELEAEHRQHNLENADDHYVLIEN